MACASRPFKPEARQASMTALELLTLISAAILLQVLAVTGMALWRRRQTSQAGAAQSADSPVAAMADAAGAWAGWREFRVSKTQFEDACESQRSFHLAPLDGGSLPPFKPGQFLTFQLSVAATDQPTQRTENDTNETQPGRPVTRCYSLSDSPDPGFYRITVKRVPAPAGHPELPAGLSSNHLHDHVHEGGILRVKAPSGRFHIAPSPALPAVLVAGGIGITPMMSMLRWCLKEQPARAVHLFYGLRNSDDFAFQATLRQLAAAHPLFHLHVAFSRPGAHDIEGRDYQHAGHVDIELLKKTLPHGRHQFYVCGPTAMMESLVPALADWGVPEQDIHFEAFGPASISDQRATASASVDATATQFGIRFAKSGRTLDWDGRDASLLEFAERHGVEVDSGCRSGSCGSCEIRLLSGNVEYRHKPDHDVAPGHCLLCVGRPASALELEA